MKLQETHDPMGLAIRDYFEGHKLHRLRVLSSMFEEDEMPIKNLFRSEKEMPELEQKAIRLCQGKTLDIGAGAGCHSLALQARGINVTAIDISPTSVETMRRRGILHAECADLFTDDFGSEFDTIILLMNGLGIAGTLSELPTLLLRCQSLLAPGGCILTDSSDLRYIFEDEEGNLDWNPDDGYYGEVDYKMIYGKCEGEPFNWLYVDYKTLATCASEIGLQIECIARGPHYDYLAKLKNSK